jgi:hypothetical protein
MMEKESEEERDYSLLYKRVIELKMQELFQEPYDGDMEEEE